MCQTDSADVGDTWSPCIDGLSHRKNAKANYDVTPSIVRMADLIEARSEHQRKASTIYEHGRSSHRGSPSTRCIEVSNLSMMVVLESVAVKDH
jgi:hypothetical protein